MSEFVYITRLASFLPHRAVRDEEMEAVLGVVGTRPSRARRVILRNNGIRARHYVVDPDTGEARYNNAQLTAEAVRRLCDERFTLNDIECLATGTSMPDQLMPNHGVMVHGELGSPSCEVAATSGVCVSGMTALKYAWMSVKTSQHKNAVATGSEIASLVMRSQRYAAEVDRKVDELEQRPELAFEKDFLRWMLSDGAGAVLLQNEPNASDLSLRVDWIDIASYAHEMPVCMYAGGEKLDDNSLRGWMQFNHAELGEKSIFAVKQDVKLLNANVIEYCVNRPLANAIRKRGLSPDKVDWFLPHMSSNYFAQPIADGMASVGFAVRKERWFTNLSDCGNMGSASIYVMLDELVRSGRAQRGQHILCFVPESGRFSSAFMHLTVV